MKKKSIKEEEKKIPEQIQKQPDPIFNIWGWYSIEEVAAEIWNGIHSSLLEGEFVFAYKGNTDLKQFVITRRNSDYMLGVIKSGYTMLLPRVPINYLKLDFIKDLKSEKLDKEIINNLEKCLV